jgi:hypothetical protein
MPLVPRTVPTHVRTEDKVIDAGLVSLTFWQGLTLFGATGLAAELLLDAPGLPWPLRLVLAAAAVVFGIAGTFCRIDGKSLLTWLLVGLRYAGFPRRAVWRPAPLPRDAASDARWHEVTPRLAWPE